MHTHTHISHCMLSSLSEQLLYMNFKNIKYQTTLYMNFKILNTKAKFKFITT